VCVSRQDFTVSEFAFLVGLGNLIYFLITALCVGIALGGAFIQTSASPGNPLFSADELVLLALKGGLNRLNTFAPLLIPHILAAQAQLKSGDGSILRILQNMRSIVYGGMPMLPTFEDWGFENKLPLMVSSLYFRVGSRVAQVPREHFRNN
jgi:hypothetical protein